MKYQDQKDYYLRLAESDLIERVRHLLEREGYFLSDKDGKITATLHQTWNTPWHHNFDDGQSDCYIWHSIIFDNLGFIPTGCLNCFKVVVRPKTLKQLFALLDLQLELNHPCKCGIETRPTVRGLYGGYFYNRGLENGLACYTKVTEAMSNDRVLAELVPKVILKRACTEFEMKFGRSDQWGITEDNYKLEQQVEALFERKTPIPQPQHVLDHIHANWIKWAWAADDPTVDEFTDGVPLFRPVCTYQNLRLEDIRKGTNAE